MEGPAVYRISVVGRLNSQWSERLSSMNITGDLAADGQEKTILIGRLPDQAALAGVLNTLYELHMPVITVDCLESG